MASAASRSFDLAHHAPPGADHRLEHHRVAELLHRGEGALGGKGQHAGGGGHLGADEGLGCEQLVAAGVGHLIAVHGGHAGIVEQLEQIEGAAVLNTALQQDIERILAPLQIEDLLAVVELHVGQAAPLELGEEQLLLGAHPRAGHCDPHIVLLWHTTCTPDGGGAQEPPSGTVARAVRQGRPAP